MGGVRTILAAVAMTAALGAGGATAQDAESDVDMGPEASGELMPVMVHLGDLLIENPWTRATPPAAPTAAGFLSVTNHGSEPDRLIGASVPFVEEVQVHEMVMDGDLMRMQRLEDGIEIAPGETVVLKPGGYHLMMIGLGHPIAAGEDVPVTLTFKKAGSVEIVLFATEAGGSDPYSMGMGGSHEPDTMDGMDQADESDGT